jgi:hypothetical protein
MPTIFIDESGDLGSASERFFVIALVIPQNKKRLDNIVKRHCAKNKVDEIKTSLLNFPEKQDLIKKLSSVDDHSIYYVVADKNHVQPNLFHDKNLLFNYLFQWVVKPVIKSSSGTLNIILDNHTTKVTSRNSLADYIKIKAYAEWGVTSVINIQYKDSKDCKAIQIADLVANTVYGRYVYNKTHLYKLLNVTSSIKFPQGKFNT